MAWEVKRAKTWAHLDLRVIRSNAVTNKTEWDRQCLVHVDFGMWDFGHDSVSGVEARRAGTHDGHAERSILGASLTRDTTLSEAGK